MPSVSEIALVSARLGQILQLLKTKVILMLPFTTNQAITYTNCEVSRLKDGKEKLNELLSKSHVIVGKLGNDEDDGKENGKRVIRLDLPFLFH